MRDEGKIFTASDTLMPSSKSSLFPKLVITNLENKTIDLSEEIKKKKITLVSFSFNNYSTGHSEKWIENFEKIKNNNNNIQYFDIIFMQEFYLKLFKKYLLKNYKLQTIKERHPFTLISFDKLKEEEKSFLGISVMITNYVFLVDQDGKIRWQLTGVSNEKDLNKLKEFINKI
jgi:mitochondrial ATPase complex subunit ATP10